MLIKFTNTPDLKAVFSAASAQIKSITASGGGSLVIIDRGGGVQTQAIVTEPPDEATDIVNKQGTRYNLTVSSFGDVPVTPVPNPAQPTFPPAYYSSYENAVQMGLVPGVNVNPYQWYARGLTNDTTDTMLYPYASTTPSDNFLNPIAGSNTFLRIESDSAADDGTIAGAGAQTVQIDGVKIDGTPVFENVTLSGTTPVVTANEFFRVRNMSVSSYGSNGVNVGNIIIKDNATGLTHWAMGPTDGNMSGAFTPEGGKALLAKQFSLYSTSPYVELTMWLRFSAFETGRRKVIVQGSSQAPNVRTLVGAGGLPAGIEIIPTVRHTRPLSPGQTYDAYLYIEAYHITL